MSVPRFAIVGHPNKGKSSIVATLAEDDDVAISPHPGTTTQARSYPMRRDRDVVILGERRDDAALALVRMPDDSEARHAHAFAST